MLAFSFSNLGQCDFDFVEKLLPAAVAVFEELGGCNAKLVEELHKSQGVVLFRSRFQVSRFVPCGDLGDFKKLLDSLFLGHYRSLSNYIPVIMVPDKIHPTLVLSRVISFRQLPQRTPPNGREGLLDDFVVRLPVLGGTPRSGSPHEAQLPEAYRFLRY